MEQEAAVQDVALGDVPQPRHHVVVLGVTERSEEVLKDLEEEHDLAIVEKGVQLLVIVEAERHDVQVEQYVGHDDDADDDLEDDHELTLSVQYVPVEIKMHTRQGKIRLRLSLMQAHRQPQIQTYHGRRFCWFFETLISPAFVWATDTLAAA